MKKNTHRPGLANSANRPDCTDRGRKKTTGKNSDRPFLMVAGGKKASAFELGHLDPLPLRLRINAKGIRLVGQLGPDMEKCVGKKIASGHQSLCKCLDSSTMHNGHRSLTCHPLRDHGRLDSKVLSKPNAATNFGVEPFNKFVHARIIRPSLMYCNRYCLRQCGS